MMLRILTRDGTVLHRFPDWTWPVPRSGDYLTVSGRPYIITRVTWEVSAGNCDVDLHVL